MAFSSFKEQSMNAFLGVFTLASELAIQPQHIAACHKAPTLQPTIGSQEPLISGSTGSENL